MGALGAMREAEMSAFPPREHSQREGKAGSSSFSQQRGGKDQGLLEVSSNSRRLGLGLFADITSLQEGGTRKNRGWGIWEPIPGIPGQQENWTGLLVYHTPTKRSGVVASLPW